MLHDSLLTHVDVPQAELILRAWATSVLQSQYGSHPVLTNIWNVTMTEVAHPTAMSRFRAKILTHHSDLKLPPPDPGG